MSNSKGTPKKRPPLQRILAWIAIGILLALYAASFICAMIDSPFAQQMFHACIYCTIFVPIISWVFIMTIKMVKDRQEED